MKTKLILAVILSLLFFQASLAGQSSTMSIRNGFPKIIKESSTFSIDSIKNELMHPVLGPKRMSFRMATILQFRLDSVSNDFANYYYTYNQSNQLVSIAMYESSEDGYDYADSVLIEYSYDTQNRIICVLQSNVSLATFVSKVSYSYAPNQLIETESIWDEDNQTWIKDKESSKIYNSENLVSSIAVSYRNFHTGLLCSEYTELYTYDESNLLYTKIRTQSSSAYQSKSVYVYNTSGLIVSETIYSGMSDVYVPSRKLDYEYDDHNNVTLETESDWYGTQYGWIVVDVPAKFEYSYNSKNELFSKMEYEYDVYLDRFTPLCKEYYEYTCDQSISKLSYYTYSEDLDSLLLEFVLEYDIDCSSTVDMSHYEDVMIEEMPNLMCNQSRIYLPFGDDLLLYFTNDFHYSELTTVKLSSLSNQKFTVSPTVVNQSFRIMGEGELLELSIMDMAGKKVYTGKVNVNDEILVSSLQSGVYLVNIKTESGLITKRIIKK